MAHHDAAMQSVSLRPGIEPVPSARQADILATILPRIEVRPRKLASRRARWIPQQSSALRRAAKCMCMSNIDGASDLHSEITITRLAVRALACDIHVYH